MRLDLSTSPRTPCVQPVTHWTTQTLHCSRTVAQRTLGANICKVTFYMSTCVYVCPSASCVFGSDRSRECRCCPIFIVRDGTRWSPKVQMGPNGIPYTRVYTVAQSNGVQAKNHHPGTVTAWSTPKASGIQASAQSRQTPPRRPRTIPLCRTRSIFLQAQPLRPV